MLAWTGAQETAGVTSLSEAAAACQGKRTVGTHNDHPLDPKVLLLEQPNLHPRFLQRVNRQTSRGVDWAEVPHMDRLHVGFFQAAMMGWREERCKGKRWGGGRGRGSHVLEEPEDEVLPWVKGFVSEQRWGGVQ